MQPQIVEAVDTPDLLTDATNYVPMVFAYSGRIRVTDTNPRGAIAIRTQFDGDFVLVKITGTLRIEGIG